MVCFDYPKRKNKPLHLSPRFDQKYIHFKDTYKRLNSNELEDMFGHLQSSNLRPGTKNLGQHYYLDSVTTEYLVEINRSVKKIVHDWLNGDTE